MILLTGEEIRGAMTTYDNLGIVVCVPDFHTHWPNIAKAQLKKVSDEFEGAGIYEIQKDGAYFWNPPKV